MAITLAKSTAKLLIGGGAIYATVSQGVWSTSTEGNQAVDKVKTSVLPTANEYVRQVPDEFNNRVISGWNSGVQRAFHGLADLPNAVTEYPTNYSKLKEKVFNQGLNTSDKNQK